MSCDCFPAQRHGQPRQFGVLPHRRTNEGLDHPRRGEHLPGRGRAIPLHTSQSAGGAGEAHRHWRAAEVRLIDSKQAKATSFFFPAFRGCTPGRGSERWEAGWAGVCLHQAEEGPDIQRRGDTSVLQRTGECRLSEPRKCLTRWESTRLTLVLFRLDFPLQDPPLCDLRRQLPSDGLWKGTMAPLWHWQKQSSYCWSVRWHWCANGLFFQIKKNILKEEMEQKLGL